MACWGWVGWFGLVEMKLSLMAELADSVKQGRWTKYYQPGWLRVEAEEAEDNVKPPYFHITVVSIVFVWKKVVFSWESLLLCNREESGNLRGIHNSWMLGHSCRSCSRLRPFHCASPWLFKVHVQSGSLQMRFGQVIIGWATLACYNVWLMFSCRVSCDRLPKRSRWSNV